MRVPQPDISEHFGNADAVPQPPERCLSRQAGIVRYCLKELVENKRLREQRLYVLGNNGVHRIRVSCAPGLPVLACGCSSLAQLHQQGGELLFIYGADGIA